MLVLSRRIGESIIINDTWTATVVNIRESEVVFRITSPRGSMANTFTLKRTSQQSCRRKFQLSLWIFGPKKSCQKFA